MKYFKSKWLWKMRYCKKNGIPPAQAWAWNKAEVAWQELPIEERDKYDQ